MKKVFNAKIIVPVIVLVVAVIAIDATLQNGVIETNELEGQEKILRAVILDQLSEEIPNKHFQKRATEILEGAGYEVDLVESQNLTVDFYKNLPSMNYNYIVLRSHAVPQETPDTPVVLFTGEPYSTEEYISDQLWGHVMRAAPVGFSEFSAQVPEGGWVVVNDTYKYYEQPVKHRTYGIGEYFAVSPKLVDELMVGKFPSSTILLGGCGTLSNESMAKSLLNRGASVVVGWDDLVGSGQNDRALLSILEDNLANNLDIEESVESYMASLNPNLNSMANLKYFSDEDLKNNG